MVAIVVHCGAGSRDNVLDAAERAAERGMEILEQGGTALDAVVEAVVVLEDDERLNAGIGSRLNLEGVAEMDASVMDSEMNCGAVAAIHGVKNPILVARKVLESPHVLLCGDGAVKFARRCGFEDFDPTTPRSLEALQEVRRRLRSGDLPKWARAWEGFLTDTVGAVARDEAGKMAAANSTGGISIKLPGRVGDTPLIGCGIYAGPAAAVTATGIGEEIVRRVLCKGVYDSIEEGEDPQTACEVAISRFLDDIPTGIIAISPKGYGVGHNTTMAWARRPC